MLKSRFLHSFSEFLRPDICLRLAKLHGWFKRRGKIHPAQFLIAQVFGQASALHPSLIAQTQSYTTAVTRQAVDQRYHQGAVDYFVAAFEQSLHQSLEKEVQLLTPPLLREQFAAIRLFDSTQMTLPAVLAARFPACGGKGSEAGLKVLLCYEYFQSAFQPLALLCAKRSDQGLAGMVGDQVGAQELGLFDKGFFDRRALGAIDQRGGFFLMPLPRSVSLWECPEGGEAVAIPLVQRLREHAGDHLELTQVRLGQGPRALHGVRLVAYRLSEKSAQRQRQALREKARTQGRPLQPEAMELAAWHILITNVPPAKLPVEALIYLYRLRWQIELIFKQLKDVLRIDQVPSGNEHRLQCEVWARLLAAVLLFSCHRFANADCLARFNCEISFAKLARRFQQEGLGLARVIFQGGYLLHQTLSRLWDLLLKSARKGHQKSRKTTRQKLLIHWLEPLCAAAPFLKT